MAGEMIKFAPLLDTCGLAWRKWRHPHLLAPLCTGKFFPGSHQLSALGNTVISSSLCSALLQYCLAFGCAPSHNLSNQATALMHNHFVLRYIAEQRCGLMQIGNLQSNRPASSLDSSTVGQAMLGELESPERVPRRHVLRGTAFEFAPHAFGQSTIASKFCHFIGAVLVDQGEVEAEMVVRKLWQIEPVEDFVQSVRRVTERVVQHFPISNVALAVLAAQGIRVQLKARTIVLPSPASNWEQETMGKDTTRVQQPSVVATMHAESSHKWFQAATHCSLAPVCGSDGWLAKESEHPSTPIGSDVPNSFFADAVGLHHFPSVQYVSARKHRSPIRDPTFGSKDGKNGIEIDTNGLPTKEFIHSFNLPHTRQFEVSLVKARIDATKGSREPVILLAKAVASRYTEARVLACRNYMLSALADVERLGRIRRSPLSTFQ